MTRVQDIETAVGHDDALLSRPRLADEHQEFIPGYEPSPALAALVQGDLDLARGHRGHTDLAHDQACSDVCQR